MKHGLDHAKQMNIKKRNSENQTKKTKMEFSFDQVKGSAKSKVELITTKK